MTAFDSSLKGTGANKPFPMRTPREKYNGYMVRLGQLKTERSPYDSHWAELDRHILPRSARFFTTDRNRNDRSAYNKIYDNTATRSVDVLSAGVMSHLSNPASQWFRLVPANPDLRDNHAARLWLDEVEERMLMIFSRSNVYRVLPTLYEDLGVYGTAASLVLGDFDNLIHMYPLSIGEYYLQQDNQGRITTVYREFQRTVIETVKEFGYENVSPTVRDAYNNRSLEQPVQLLHVIEPRADQDRNLTSKLAVDMPWRSIYLEKTDNNTILRESGFDRLPLIAPRWDVRGADTYGTKSPGMIALGDIMQLQHEQLRKGQGIDYQTKPPLQVPHALKDKVANRLPGGLNFYEPGAILPFDQVTPHGGIRNAFEVQLDLSHLLLDIEDCRGRIRSAFHHDTFMLLATLQRGQMTLGEVLERKSEGLMQLGPVVGRATNELHTPLIDITFNRMADAQMLPDAPPELQGQELTVEFQSVLAQAQKAARVSAIQTYVGDVLGVAQVVPQVTDKVNWDEWAEVTGDMRGVPAELMVEDEDVQAVRDARAQRDAAVEQTALAKEQAGAVKDLAQAPANNDSVLAEVAQ